ncbi:metal-dependent transcriptional regulator [Ruminiclostridium cellobioparum]|uniref:Manganese transport regulator n=1 Tax=Ruminiclostridium cellobioparum subsp. termitidis CT1112 TaxID=1195236 RepID=S0FFV0_RUMCE|nr:metal-dependent transcriptional regulator [Ruminiclostridium cellobioparum]EMS69990.1 Mn-dependent transcriptional regulator [Ruminiclostridium cellobioparum subsp. termitidis CT1112]
MLSNSKIKYLICVYKLSNGGGPVKSVDIANTLSVTKYSVFKMLKYFAEIGLIEKQHYGQVHLTPEGIRKANSLYTEYVILYTFFTKYLNVSAEVAEDDAIACIGVLSSQSIDRISNHIFN